MQIIQLNKRLIAQFIAVLSTLFLVYHYKEHYEDYYHKKHDDERDLLAMTVDRSQIGQMTGKGDTEDGEKASKDTDDQKSKTMSKDEAPTVKAERNKDDEPAEGDAAPAKIQHHSILRAGTDKNDRPQELQILEEALRSTSIYHGEKDAGLVVKFGEVMYEGECERLINVLDGKLNAEWMTAQLEQRVSVAETHGNYYVMSPVDHNGRLKTGFEWMTRFSERIWNRIKDQVPKTLKLKEGYILKNPRIPLGNWQWKKYEVGQFIPAHRDNYSQYPNSGRKLTLIISLTGKNEKGKKAFEGGGTKFVNDPSHRRARAWSPEDDLLNTCTESLTVEAIMGNGFAFDGSLMHGGCEVKKIQDGQDGRHLLVEENTKYIMTAVIEYEEYLDGWFDQWLNGKDKWREYDGTRDWP